VIAEGKLRELQERKTQATLTRSSRELFRSDDDESKENEKDEDEYDYRNYSDYVNETFLRSPFELRLMRGHARHVDVIGALLKIFTICETIIFTVFSASRLIDQAYCGAVQAHDDFFFWGNSMNKISGEKLS
jgi:hypothetical protein